MAEVLLLDSTQIVTHPLVECANARGGIARRADCISIEARCSVDSPLHLPKPLFHIARGMGRGSSAASKYFQILCEGPLTLVNPQTVICLADGCGGVLAMLMHLFPQA